MHAIGAVLWLTYAHSCFYMFLYVLRKADIDEFGNYVFKKGSFVDGDPDSRTGLRPRPLPNFPDAIALIRPHQPLRSPDLGAQTNHGGSQNVLRLSILTVFRLLSQEILSSPFSAYINALLYFREARYIAVQKDLEAKQFIRLSPSLSSPFWLVPPALLRSSHRALGTKIFSTARCQRGHKLSVTAIQQCFPVCVPLTLCVGETSFRSR